MNAITVTLPDERFERLRETAAKFSVTPEELVLASVQELLSRPDEAFQRALERVLEKNEELYERLA